LQSLHDKKIIFFMKMPLLFYPMGSPTNFEY